MSSQFAVMNVSSDFMMDVAKVIASSPHPLTKDDLLKSFTKSEGYISLALSQCLQLGLANLKDEAYVGPEKYRDLLKRSDRSQLFLALRQALQIYPPFLLYVDFVSKGYSSDEAATMTKGIFRIESSKKIVESSFRKWGLHSQLIEEDDSGGLSIPEAEKGLPSQYVKGLLKALKADLQASIFIIETMSQQAFAYLSQKKISIKDLTDGLINYEIEPKASTSKACQTFEHFLFKLGEDLGLNMGAYNGIIEYSDAIRGVDKTILRNQLHLCHGIGGLRNMAHHDPDKETGNEWIFTPQGAIVSSIIVPTMIRSLYLHWTEGKQEF